MHHDEMIEYLRKKQNEHVIIVKDGEIIKDIIGDEVKVSLDNLKLYLLENATLYHNHIKSSTFSFSDVSNMLLFNAEMMFLVTKNFLYSIKSP